jgi:hypothetical protein
MGARGEGEKRKKHEDASHLFLPELSGAHLKVKNHDLSARKSRLKLLFAPE